MPSKKAVAALLIAVVVVGYLAYSFFTAYQAANAYAQFGPSPSNPGTCFGSAPGIQIAMGNLSNGSCYVNVGGATGEGASNSP